VLIVDDNGTNRLILMKTLEARGCRPVLASDGREALNLLVQWARLGEPFDLVLLDMQMPELDGVATARLVRREPTIRDVRIVALTSIGHGLASLPPELGLAAALSKPVKQRELLDAVARASRAPASGVVPERHPAPSHGTARP
jgi:CheY-like chemotaxis protein